MRIREIQRRAFETAQEKGWWDEPREVGTLIALMHSELSEALEADREGNWRGEDGVVEELSDTIIRICDFAAYHGIDLDSAIREKLEENEEREHKHGGKKY